MIDAPATQSRYLDPADAALRVVVRRILEIMALCTADPDAFRAYFLRLCAADIEAADFAPEDGSDPEMVRTAAMIALGDFMGALPSPTMETPR